MRSTRLRRMAVLTAAVAVLAAPAQALAQGAGDEQYSDPFAGGGSGSGTQSQSQSQSPATSSGSTTQAPTTSSSSSSAPAAAAPATSASQLPRTGLDLRIPASAGLVLLLAGLALWRRRPADDGR